MISARQRQMAKKFRAMHEDAKMFILPNAWDAGSAYVFERQGFQAVATTSAGLAYAQGLPDGEEMTIDDLVSGVDRINRRIGIPLSVDFERGYAEDIGELKDSARRLIYHGAIGFNLEDGKADGSLDELTFMVKKIGALVELKEELGLDFIINARTCAYWLDVASETKKLEIALERGKAFRACGADCVFVPGGLDAVTVKALVKGIGGPLNIILNPINHDIKSLEEMGVRRLSVGSGLVRSVFHHLKGLADDLLAARVEEIFDHPFSYGAANEYFKL